MKTLYHNCKIISRGQMFDGAVLAQNGLILEVLREEEVLPPADEAEDLKGAVLAPAFCDTHIHGCGGFGADNKNPRDLLEMSKILAAQGVAAFTPTIYPAKIDEMVSVLRALFPAIGKEEGAKITGFHLEGPFISPSKPGVMKPEDIQKINIASAEKLLKAADGKISAMTVAPELEGIEDLAAFAKTNAFILQTGHTDASYEQTQRAADLGILHCTHLFNAMNALSHRVPGVPGAVLSDNRFTAEVIADGLHLHPAVIKMIFALKGPDGAVLVTDSLNPTGRQEGKANNDEVFLDNGLFRRKADKVIAGSSLTMLGAFKNLLAWGIPPERASLAASDNPAALHKLNLCSLTPGKLAKLIVLDKDFNLVKALGF
jgi:N-acetylglucosamine-6-phosphate deacetylase